MAWLTEYIKEIMLKVFILVLRGKIVIARVILHNRRKLAYFSRLPKVL
jgi:hypothetical protein